MAIKTRTYLNKFNRGEIDPNAMARDDVVKINSSAATMKNFIPTRLGSMMYRPGTEHVGTGVTGSKLIPFIAATDDTAILEFYNGGMQIWVDDALVTRTAVTTTVTNGEFTTDLAGWTDADEAGASSTWNSGVMSLDGDGTNSAIRWQTMTTEVGVEHGISLHVIYESLRLRIGTAGASSDDIFDGVLKAGVHRLAFTPSGNITVTLSNSKSTLCYVQYVRIDSAGVVAIEQPTTTDNIDSIRYAQSADTIFCAAVNTKPFVIERRGVRSWSVVDYQYTDGPFNTINDTSTTMTASGYSGDVNLTSSAPYFKATDVGMLFKLSSAGQAASNTVSAQDTGTASVRVTGVDVARRFNFYITGLTGTGSTIVVQSSPDDATWADVLTYTTDQSNFYYDALDNSTLYYRLWCKTGGYSTGTIILTITFPSGSIAGVARITGITSTTVATAQVLTDFGGLTATRDWYRGTWSATNDKYPTAVALYEGRLWWAGKSQVWSSVSDAYYSFDSGLEGDSASIQRTIGFGPVDDVAWLMPVNRLLMGIASDELAIRSNSFGDILKPSNANIKAGSSQGSALIDPIKVNGRVYFVQRSLQKIYQLEYRGEQDIHDSLDITLLNPRICQPGIKRIAVTMQPDVRIWVLLTDGTLRIYLIDATEDVRAWSRWDTDGVVADITVLPDTTEDRVYINVVRNSVTNIEKLSLFSESIGGTISNTFDSLVQYTSPGTTLTGLAHLNGKTIGVWADGQYRGTAAVSAGSATVAGSWTNVSAGLRYVADYKTTKLNQFTDRSVLTYDKRVVDVGFVLLDYWPGSLTVGPDSSTLGVFPTTEDGTVVGATATLSEYDEPPFPFNGATESDPRIHLQANNPCTILAMTYGIEEHSDQADPQGGRN